MSHPYTNFALFMSSFPSDFIERCWGTGGIGTHLRAQLDSYATDGVIRVQDFHRWYLSLDAGNRKKLNNWIDENFYG